MTFFWSTVMRYTYSVSSDDLLCLFVHPVGIVYEPPDALYGVALGHEVPRGLGFGVWNGSAGME